jgi:hypothetical protein
MWMSFGAVVGILVQRGYALGPTVLSAPHDAQDDDYEEVVRTCCTPGQGPSCCPIQWRRKGHPDQFIGVAVHVGVEVISFGTNWPARS